MSLISYSLISKKEFLDLPKLALSYLKKYSNIFFKFISKRKVLRWFFYSLFKLRNCANIPYALMPEIGNKFILIIPSSQEKIELPYSNIQINKRMSSLINILFNMVLSDFLFTENISSLSQIITSEDSLPFKNFCSSFLTHLRITTISPKVSQYKSKNNQIKLILMNG